MEVAGIQSVASNFNILGIVAHYELQITNYELRMLEELMLDAIFVFRRDLSDETRIKASKGQSITLA